MIIIFAVLVSSIIALAVLRAKSEVLIRKYMDTDCDDDEQVIAIRKNLRVKWHRYDAAERIIYIFIFAILLGHSISEVLLWWIFLLIVYGITFDMHWNKLENRHRLYLGKDAKMDTTIRRFASFIRLDYKILNLILRIASVSLAGYFLVDEISPKILTDLSDWEWIKNW